MEEGPISPPEAKAVPENWEAKKAELVKNWDEAMTQARVGRSGCPEKPTYFFIGYTRGGRKLREAERGLRMSNVHIPVVNQSLYITEADFNRKSLAFRYVTSGLRART
jgi:hypothetical protein